MNQVLKKLLEEGAKIAVSGASNTVPGAGMIIRSITSLIDKDDSNNIAAVDELEAGLVTALQNLKPNEVENITLVTAGLVELRSGFRKIKKGLKK